MKEEKKKVLKKVKAWLGSEEPDYVEFLGRLLSSLPDGDNDVFPPVVEGGMGWVEMELIASLLTAIENGKDVQVALRYLFGI